MVRGYEDMYSIIMNQNFIKFSKHFLGIFKGSEEAHCAVQRNVCPAGFALLKCNAKNELGS